MVRVMARARARTRVTSTHFKSLGHVFNRNLSLTKFPKQAQCRVRVTVTYRVRDVRVRVRALPHEKSKFFKIQLIRFVDVECLNRTEFRI